MSLPFVLNLFITMLDTMKPQMTIDLKIQGTKTSINGADMIQRIATANIVQTTEEMNPEGLPIGGFRITLFHVPSPGAEPVFVGAGDVNPFEEGGSDNLGFNIYSPGGYYAECTRLTAMGQPIGPVATSTTRYVGDGTATFRAPLVITLGISSVPA